LLDNRVDPSTECEWGPTFRRTGFVRKTKLANAEVGP
jgi:hypothetical protein